MYVNKAMLCVFKSFILRANIYMFIAAKLSQIALFTYICSLGATIKNKRAFRGYREYFRQFQGFRHRNTQ